MSIAAIDTETVPDIDLARKVHTVLENKTDEEVVEWIYEVKGRDGFQKTLYHKIVSFSISLWSKDEGFDILRLGTMTEKGRDEASILSDFGEFLADQGGASSCKLVSFNGSSFDLPVIAQRAIRYGSDISLLWDQGHINKNHKWNNYVSRYHDAHTDIVDMLAFYNNGNKFSLHDLSLHCGLPGKIGVGGCSVLKNYMEGNYSDIDDYCDIDTLLTFLCYVNLARNLGLHGKYTPQQMKEDVITFLNSRGPDHNSLFEEFYNQW